MPVEPVSVNAVSVNPVSVNAALLDVEFGEFVFDAFPDESVERIHIGSFWHPREEVHFSASGELGGRGSGILDENPSIADAWFLPSTDRRPYLQQNVVARNVLSVVHLDQAALEWGQV